MVKLFNFIDRESPIHALTGASKLACTMCWIFAAMVTFDTRYLIFLTAAAAVLFRVSKIRLSDVKVLLAFTLVFLALNNVLIYLFSPEHGVTVYGSRTLLVHIIGRYTITSQQLLYHLNVVLKYTATIPVVMLFVCTTQPSEFASSLSRIGVSYRISYSVSLALRYIPDVMKEFRDISLAQQARGTEMSKKASLVNRLKAASSILIPLILSSMERIETISNAMELRGFGKGRTRTWYSSRKFSKMDILCMAASAALLLISLALSYWNGGRYFNPFVG